MALYVRPCTLKQANDLVSKIHRHHKPVVSHRFSLACYNGGVLCGVVITGRPVARNTDPYLVLEITRCATDGTRNAISKLYSAVCSAAKSMGFISVQTFTLPEEGGASLKASGFTFLGKAGGGQWVHTDGRERRKDQPTQTKWKWERRFEDTILIEDL